MNRLCLSYLIQCIRLRSLSIILHRVDGRDRSTVVGSKLLTSISSATNTCSTASLISSSVTKIGVLCSSASSSSSGSKTRVMLVLLKSAKTREYYSYDIPNIHSLFFLLAKGGERVSSSGIFGGRGRDEALASSTVKGTTTSSTREAICADLVTRTGRNVTGLSSLGS